MSVATTMKVAAGACVATTAILACGYLADPSPLLFSLVITFGVTSYHFVMRFAVAAVVNAAMHNRADYTKSHYQVGAREMALYQRLHVKHWKNHMPTYSPERFDPRRHSWDEIAQTMCQSEVVHEVIVMLSFLPIALAPLLGSWSAFITTSVVAAGIDTAFVIMQRYNRARIVKMLKRKRR